MRSIAIGPKHHGLAAVFAAAAGLLAMPWNKDYGSHGFHPAIVDWIFSHFPGLFAAAWGYALSFLIIRRRHFAAHDLRGTWQPMVRVWKTVG